MQYQYSYDYIFFPSSCGLIQIPGDHTLQYVLQNYPDHCLSGTAGCAIRTPSLCNHICFRDGDSTHSKGQSVRRSSTTGILRGAESMLSAGGVQPRAGKRHLSCAWIHKSWSCIWFCLRKLPLIESNYLGGNVCSVLWDGKWECFVEAAWHSEANLRWIGLTLQVGCAKRPSIKPVDPHVLCLGPRWGFLENFCAILQYLRQIIQNFVIFRDLVFHF